jgi:asparagine synthetase B (glutamine-hydrolysing)
LFVVHNGIIENYQELKTELIVAGHRFRSETDTEVLAHLIEAEQQKDPSIALDETVRHALMRVRGTYGIAVLDGANPGTLVAVRNFSPLLVGIGQGEYFIASDVSGLRDSVIHGQTGTLVPVLDVDALEHAMIDFILDEKYRITLSDNAYDWSHNFSWDESSKQFFLIVADALRTSKAPLGRIQFAVSKFISLFI